MRAVLLAASIAAILMMFPLGVLGLVFCGGFCVALYRRRTPGLPVTSAMGWRLGAATGSMAFLIFAVIGAVQVVVFHTGDQLREVLLNAVRQAAEQRPDAQAQQVLEYLKTPAGTTFTLVFGMIVVFIFFVILSALGGVIGAAWFGKKRAS
jgi:ABC-type methionine transport system permease subunit